MVKFTGEYGRFDNLAPDEPPPGADEYDDQAAA
jgi:hypothetical protein